MVFWRAWRFSIFLAALTPVLFLSAMGLGLGSMVEEREAFGGVEFIDFFATGLLAANCFQIGVFDATYPIMSKMVWQRNYEAILASPLGVRDIFLGELSWIAIVLTLAAIPFFVIMAFMGIVASAIAVLAIPIGVLTGVACASVVFAFTATLQTDEAYTWLFRLVVTPLFLLSGTFFPVSELPGWGRWLAEASPLYHGVELIRQVSIYDLEASALWHTAFLVVLLGLGTSIGIRNLERRLVP